MILMKVNDITGRTFGRLIVLSRVENSKQGKARFECRCECNRFTTVLGTHLVRGTIKSCGCWRVEMPAKAFRKHGGKGTAEYRIWGHMKTRCLNPKSRYYHRYGGRGIAICPEWLTSFEAFFRDMGSRPSRRHSIERLDGNKGYSPDNCCWALPLQQSSNRSTVRQIEHNGITDTIAGWARRTGIPYLKLRRRLVDGWNIERALATLDKS